MAKPYPFAWPAGESRLQPAGVRQTMAAVSAMEPVPVRGNDPARWHDMFMRPRANGDVLLHPLWQAFLVGLPHAANSPSHTLLARWAAASKARFEWLVGAESWAPGENDPGDDRELVCALVDLWTYSPRRVNQVLTATATSLDQAIQQPWVAAATGTSARLKNAGEVARVLFAGPRAICTPLPMGAVLFEGHSSDQWHDIDPVATGIDSHVVRTAATSVSWHPDRALWSTDTEQAASAITDPVVNRRMHTGADPAAVPSLLLVHKIASPNVLGCDVQQLRSTYFQTLLSRQDRCEVMLQPFTRFHVCNDEVAVLPLGYAHAGATVQRLLYTHVYVEDECPMCKQQVAAAPV